MASFGKSFQQGQRGSRWPQSGRALPQSSAALPKPSKAQRKIDSIAMTDLTDVEVGYCPAHITNVELVSSYNLTDGHEAPTILVPGT